MGKRFDRVDYDSHAQERMVERGIEREMVELVLEHAAVRYPSRGAFVAEMALSGKDELALRVVYAEPAPRSAFVITVHQLPRRRTRL